MAYIIAIIFLITIALPMTQSKNMILDEYHSNGISNIAISIRSTQKDLLFRSENLLGSFFDNASNIFQRLVALPDTFVDNILKYTIALFVVIDPIGTVPLFIALTEKMRTQERKAVSKIAVVTAGVLLIVFAVAGTQILSIFGITISSFMIAGGVLLFIVSIELLTHGEWRFGAAGAQGESGVVPLAFPLLAGPGAITAVIISFQTSV